MLLLIGVCVLQNVALFSHYLYNNFSLLLVEMGKNLRAQIILEVFKVSVC